MSDLIIGTRTSARCIVLMPAGDLDVDSALEFRWALIKAIDADVQTVTVDLSQVRLCDSVGMSTLIFGYQSAGMRGVAFAVINARGAVARALDATGLSDLLSPNDPPPISEPGGGSP